MSTLTARPVAENRWIAAAKALTFPGVFLAFSDHPVLITVGIAALVAGVALAFRFGITTGRWEQ